VFCLPTANPVTSQTVNYTPVAVGIVAIATLGTWFLWAHKWFVGPRRQIELEIAGVPSEDAAALAEAEKKGLVGEKQLDM
jgi:hypothetical protein